MREGKKNGKIKNNSCNKYRNGRCGKNVLQGGTDHLTKGEKKFQSFFFKDTKKWITSGGVHDASNLISMGRALNNETAEKEKVR